MCLDCASILEDLLNIDGRHALCGFQPYPFNATIWNEIYPSGMEPGILQVQCPRQ
jgi:hypothetical protein